MEVCLAVRTEASPSRAARSSRILLPLSKPTDMIPDRTEGRGVMGSTRLYARARKRWPAGEAATDRRRFGASSRGVESGSEPRGVANRRQRATRWMLLLDGALGAFNAETFSASVANDVYPRWSTT